MLVIPAIDILNGRCVRLRQGDVDNKTVYDADPLSYAVKFADMGAERIHVVDLDAAMTGKPVNRALIRTMVEEVGSQTNIQIGGGLRHLSTIENCLNDGVHYMVVGTMAIENQQFLRDACTEFGEHILLSIDAKGGMIATHGWQKVTKKNAAQFVSSLFDYALGSIVYTDIGSDGMLNGPNIAETAEIVRNSSFPVIASGGIRHLDDIKSLADEFGHGIKGAIVGKALYEEGADISELLSWAKNAQFSTT